MAEPIYHVEIPPAVNAKINNKRKKNVTADEVLDVCYHPKRHHARWDTDPKHGRRLLVNGVTEGGRRILAILQPVDVELGEWRLRTAIAEDS